MTGPYAVYNCCGASPSFRLDLLGAAVAVDRQLQRVAAALVVHHALQRVVALHRLAFHRHDQIAADAQLDNCPRSPPGAGRADRPASAGEPRSTLLDQQAALGRQSQHLRQIAGNPHRA